MLERRAPTASSAVVFRTMRAAATASSLLAFAACPAELSCISDSDGRVRPTLATANEKIAHALVDCGYLSDGTLGAATFARFRGEDSRSHQECALDCLYDLSEDCAALHELACLRRMPSTVSECLRACGDCREGMSHARCMGVAVDCGMGLPANEDSWSSDASVLCSDGSVSLPQARMCDFVADCPDGSDEGRAAGCARVLCSATADVDASSPEVERDAGL